MSFADVQPGKRIRARHILELQELVGGFQDQLDAIPEAADLVDMQADIASHEVRMTVAEAEIATTGLRTDLLQYRKPTIVALGDSITSNGISNDGAGPRNWLLYACIASAGKMHWLDSVGGGGYKTAQIMSDLVPQLLELDPRPGYCAVLAGANDTNVTAFASWSASYTDILDALTEAGIMPVICPIPPNDTSSKHADAAKFNAWLNLQAKARGIPYVDWLGDLMDPATGGSWLAGLESDGVHPIAAGAKAMGDALWRELEPWITAQPIWKPYLATSNTDPTNLHTNGLFLTDTDANGFADNMGGTEGGVGTILTYVTPTLESAVSGDCIGNWQQLVRIASGSTYINIFGAADIAVAEGDRISLAFRIKTADIVSSATAIGNIGLMQGVGTTIPVGLTNPTDVATDRWWINGHDYDIAAMTVYQELTVRTGATAARFLANLGSNATSGTISFAQLTIRNLTDLGID